MEIDVQQLADQLLALKILWGTDLNPLHTVGTRKCIDVKFECSLDLSSSLMESVTWKEVSLDVLDFACCGERNGSCRVSETSVLTSFLC